MKSRREPLLWLQCLSIGALPLEALMLKLVLAGADVGPVPGLERLFTWSLGVVLPAVLLWKRPPDWGSLLLAGQSRLQRSRFQRQLSAAQTAAPIRLICAIGAVPLLGLLWWLDDSALLVSDLSPVQGLSRLGVLLIAAPVLAVMLWQWQQLVQACWLLTRDDEVLNALKPLSDMQLSQEITAPGLNVLSLAPLEWAPSQATGGAVEPDKSPEQQETGTSGDSNASHHPVTSEAEVEKTASAVEESEQTEETEQTGQPSGVSAVAGAVEPEQRSEQQNCTDLDPEIAEHDIIAGTEAEAHDEETEPSGREEGEPEETTEPPPGSP